MSSSFFRSAVLILMTALSGSTPAWALRPAQTVGSPAGLEELEKALRPTSALSAGAEEGVVIGPETDLKTVLQVKGTLVPEGGEVYLREFEIDAITPVRVITTEYEISEGSGERIPIRVRVFRNNNNDLRGYLVLPPPAAGVEELQKRLDDYLRAYLVVEEASIPWVGAARFGMPVVNGRATDEQWTHRGRARWQLALALKNRGFDTPDKVNAEFRRLVEQKRVVYLTDQEKGWIWEAAVGAFRAGAEEIQRFVEPLKEIAQGRAPTEEEIQGLAAALEADPVQTAILAIPAGKTAEDVVRDRVEVMQKVWPAFSAWWNNYFKDKPTPIPPDTLWRVYLPQSQWILEQKRQVRPDGVYVYGVSGGQGAGKTVLVGALASILNVLLSPAEGQAVARSIDDYYKSKKDREALKPLGYDPGQGVSNRGPPGTHYTDWIWRNIQEFETSTPASKTALGNYSKTPLDDQLPEPFIVAGKVGIFLLEGWFLGANTRYDLSQIPPGFPRVVAEANRRDYQQISDRLDGFFAFARRPIEEIKRDREQQEQTNASQHGGKRGMSPEAIERFVDYFYVDSWHPGITSPYPRMEETTFLADVDADRRFRSIEIGGRHPFYDVDYDKPWRSQRYPGTQAPSSTSAKEVDYDKPWRDSPAAGAEEAVSAMPFEWGGAPTIQLHPSPHSRDSVILRGFNAPGDLVWIRMVEKRRGWPRLGFRAVDSGGEPVRENVQVFRMRPLRKILESALAPEDFQEIWIPGENPEKAGYPDFRNPKTPRLLSSEPVRQVLADWKKNLQKKPLHEGSSGYLLLDFELGDSVLLFNTAGEDRSSWVPFVHLTLIERNRNGTARMHFSAPQKVRVDRKSVYEKETGFAGAEELELGSQLIDFRVVKGSGIFPLLAVNGFNSQEMAVWFYRDAGDEGSPAQMRGNPEMDPARMERWLTEVMRDATAVEKDYEVNIYPVVGSAGERQGIRSVAVIRPSFDQVRLMQLLILTFDPAAGAALQEVGFRYGVTVVAPTPTDYGNQLKLGVPADRQLGLLWGGMDEKDYLSIRQGIGGMLAVDPSVSGWQDQVVRMVSQQSGRRPVVIYDANTLASSLQVLGIPGSAIERILEIRSRIQAGLEQMA